MSEPTAGDFWGGDAVPDDIGVRVADLLRSAVGVELLYRLLIPSLNFSSSDDFSLSLDECGFLRLDAVRGLLSEIGPLFCRSRYGCEGGIISSVLERRKSVLSIMKSSPLPLSCARLQMFRRVLVEVESLLFVRGGSGKGVQHRLLRSAGDIAWDRVVRMLRDESIEFEYVFRHPDLMKYICGIRNSGKNGKGRVEGNIGRNFLECLLLCYRPGVDCSPMLDCIKAFDERDSSSSSGMALTQIRNLEMGSPAAFFRAWFLSAVSGNGDALAAKSPIFSFLRDRFRSGCHYVSDVDDDYGQTMYYHLSCMRR